MPGNFYQSTFLTIIAQSDPPEVDPDYLVSTFKALNMEGERSYETADDISRSFFGTLGAKTCDYKSAKQRRRFKLFDGENLTGTIIFPLDAFRPYRPPCLTKKMENIFIHYTMKYCGDKIDYKTCAKILSRFRFYERDLVSEQEAEKIFFDYFLRESPTVNNFLYDANSFQKIFLSLAAKNSINNMNYISTTFNRLKMDQEQEYPLEWIIDAYRSLMDIFINENILNQCGDWKEMVDTMEKHFVESTIDNLSLDYDWTFCSKVISRFRDRKDSDLLSEEEVEKLCFNAFLRNSPTVRHFLEDASDFQRVLLSCAAKYYGSDADLKYIALIFNEVKANENQQFPDEWIIDTYQSSLETLRTSNERTENHTHPVYQCIIYSIIMITIEYFKRNFDFKFSTELINSFLHLPIYDNYNDKEVSRIFIRLQGYEFQEKED